MLDDAWPAATRARAEADVSAALAGGRVAAGDLVVFSSGSTDHPRGVARTWASWEASADPLTDLVATPEGAVGVPGRLASTLSLHAAWHARATGRDVVLADEWTPDNLAAVTVVHTLPDRPLRWASWPPALRTLVVAGDRTPAAVHELCAARGVRLVEYYGSVEASFVLAADTPDTAAPPAAGSVRPLYPFAGVDVRVDDLNRLWSRSSLHFREYLGADGPARRDPAGWLTVGDVAERDGTGYRLLGRAGTVTTGGHSVQVADVEAALAAAPGVRAAVVCGVPHAVLGQVIGVVAEVGGDPVAARSTLQAWAVRSLPPSSRPRRWRFVSALPRTLVGKPDRAAARGLLEVADSGEHGQE